MHSASNPAQSRGDWQFFARLIAWATRYNR